MKHYKLDQYFEFTFSTQRFDTGAATDADATPTYRVYEENNDTVIANGDTAKRDDANTTGYYYVRGQCTTALGYEVGKTYEVRVAGTVNSVAGAAVVGRFAILPAAVWDSLYGGTDYLPVDTVQVEGADATDTIRDSVVDDATRIDASALNTLSGHDPGAAIAKAGDAMTLTAAYDAAKSAAAAGDAMTLTAAYDAAKTAAQAGSAMTLTAEAITSVQAGLSTLTAQQVWEYATRALTDKAGFSLAANQSGVTIGTVTTLTGHTPQTGDSYARLGAPAGASVSADVAAVKAKTDLIPASPAAVGSAMTLANGAITAAVFAADAVSAAAVSAAAVTKITTGLSTLTAAQVNAEVVDALTVDAIPELAADPGATPTLAKAMMLAYMWLRNNTQSTATSRKVVNDAGTQVLTATMSDDGTTFSQGKLGV